MIHYTKIKLLGEVAIKLYECNLSIVIIIFMHTFFIITNIKILKFNTTCIIDVYNNYIL